MLFVDAGKRRGRLGWGVPQQRALYDERMSNVTPDAASPEGLRPQVTPSQQRVLDELLAIYLKSGDWPTHAYLEQELEGEGIDLDKELREMPEWVFAPDTRRHGGVLNIQDHEPLRLMIRGIVACSGGETEVEMLLATIKWAVRERRAVRQQPQKLVEKHWRAADAMAAMAEAVGDANLPAWSCKLVLEVLRLEPGDLPKWSGLPDAFPDWQIDIPSGIKHFRNVETIDDYLAETNSQLPGRLAPRGPLRPAAVTSSADEVDHPIFDRLVRKDGMFECFVLLPLREPFTTIYEEAVAPVAAELGLSCGHAAGIFGPGRIMKDVVASITFAEVIVAELTKRNPNVFYELGIAHQEGKQVVLLSQDIEDVPFDLREMRVVQYSWVGSEDADALRDALRPNLEKALQAARAARS
jgi:hypothetical protein